MNFKMSKFYEAGPILNFNNRIYCTYTMYNSWALHNLAFERERGNNLKQKQLIRNNNSHI